jgi:hypothetical protein
VSAFEIMYHCLITIFRKGKLVVNHAVVQTRKVAERRSTRKKADKVDMLRMSENFSD